MNLTLAIPAHNDHDTLALLLARTAELGGFSQVVVVDDGSDIPIRADDLLTAGSLRHDQLTLLRNDTARGPGAARNRALDHVTTDHLLFLDADDLPTRDLVHLLQDLDGQAFDFCVFQHHDTRMERDHSWGVMPHERACWQAAGVSAGALSPVSAQAAAHLSRTPNYPWNKIYRTGFLRDHQIRCSEILAHADIELHWRCFLNATRILASDRIAMIHFASDTGNRLTNRTGPERLKVFIPLERVAAEIAARSASDTDRPNIRAFAPPFFSFVFNLFDWIPGNLQPAFQAQFSDQAQTFLQAHLPADIRAQITQADPALTERVLTR